MPYLRPVTRCALFVACVISSTLAGVTFAQSTSGDVIYWRQNLFLIPYQMGAANEAAAGQAVVLYVSKDRGATWQAVSEAKPQVRAFNYRAEADGEYWFAIRTLDGRGNAFPPGPMQPELRVVVDTTIPRFEQLIASPGDDGTLDICWRVVDANLDPHTVQIEAQIDRDGNWQPVPAGSSSPVTGITWDAQATAVLPAGSMATAVRVTAFDRARNRAVYQTSVMPANGVIAGSASASSAEWPAIVSGRGDDVPTSSFPAASTPFDNRPNWQPGNLAATPTAPPPQPWPADRTADSVTQAAPAYVTPPSTVASSMEDGFMGVAAANDARPNPSLPQGEGIQVDVATPPVPVDDLRYAPLEPFRQASISRGADPESTILPIAGTPPRNHDYSWLGPESDVLSVDATPKLVNSRTFALEYALEHTGAEGVARVELWGTRDGGQTWRVYATDDDNRSPLIVTVDGEGLYGFRMVVESADGRGGFPPRSGERPELWVGVDMHRPDVTLSTAELGRGADAGTLVLRWIAEDDNLVPRPMALFYSSRPTGPWTAIATNLSNSGEYRWRLDRYLPTRVYLRLEARDTAGNVAAYQTTEPIAIELTDSMARVSGVQAVPAATAGVGEPKSR
jgi:hypothetical protein